MQCKLLSKTLHVKQEILPFLIYSTIDYYYYKFYLLTVNTYISINTDELLSSTGSLLDVLLDTSDAIVREWSTVDLVECLCHALEQT